MRRELQRLRIVPGLQKAGKALNSNQKGNTKDGPQRPSFTMSFGPQDRLFIDLTGRI
jgi:hypothetical protein